MQGEVDTSQFGHIVKVIYNKDVGLMVATFQGLLQIYDAMEFKPSWCTSNNDRKGSSQSTISCLDYSINLKIVAIGGVEGRIVFIDPSAKTINGSLNAHTSEVMDIYFYDK